MLKKRLFQFVEIGMKRRLFLGHTLLLVTQRLAGRVAAPERDEKADQLDKGGNAVRDRFQNPVREMETEQTAQLVHRRNGGQKNPFDRVAIEPMLRFHMVSK